MDNIDEGLQLLLRCKDGKSLLSLISQKTKDLVKYGQTKRLNLQVVLREQEITFYILDIIITFYNEPQENMRVLGKPDTVRITDLTTLRTAREFPNTLGIREWYEHILYIINARQATQIGFNQGSERFDLETIKSVFGKVDKLTCYFQGSENYAKEILRMFGCELKQLNLACNPFSQGDSRLQKLLIQNFDSLELGSRWSFRNVKLEDLLVCNSHHIQFCVNQQFDNVNRFLKLWIKGANARLRRFAIQQRNGFIPEEILKGIKIHREIPREENIFFEENDDRRYGFRTRAVDIRRYDGTTGTIILRSGFFDFLVWN